MLFFLYDNAIFYYHVIIFNMIIIYIFNATLFYFYDNPIFNFFILFRMNYLKITEK